LESGRPKAVRSRLCAIRAAGIILKKCVRLEKLTAYRISRIGGVVLLSPALIAECYSIAGTP
jgi:hypothetical protein